MTLELLDSPAGVVALRVDGVAELADVKRAEAAVEAAIAEHGRIGIVVDLVDARDMTAEALREDMAWELGLLGRLERIPRAAVVTDRQWIGAAVRAFAALAPSVEMAVFGAGRQAEAIAFAGDLPPPAAERAVTRLETESPRRLAYEVRGRMSAADVAPVIAELREAFAREGRIDLMLRLSDYEGFEPGLLADRDLIAMKLEAMSHVRRYAIIGASDWMRRMVELMDPLLSMEIRCFGAEEEAAAEAWLDEDAS